VTADYYAILGVVPKSEDVVIRAAYVALMRRYHPDANSSPAAAERAKAITHAYAVLGDPERRFDYDRRRRNGDDAYDSLDVDEAAPRGWLGKLPLERIAMLAAVLMLLLLPLYLIRYPLTVQEPPSLARADDIRRTAVRTADPAATCVSRSAQDLVRQALIRRAGQLHRGNRGAFAQLAEDSFVRIDSAAAATLDQESGTVSCTAQVTLLAPPGTQLGGKRSSLTAQIRYSLKPIDARQPAKVRLANADPMARQLATLARLPRLADLERPPPTGQVAIAVPARLPPAVAPAAPMVRPTPLAAAASRALRPPAIASPKAQPRVEEIDEAPISASFNCKFAKGRGETSVCGNRNLATVDRQLAVLYGQSWGLADAAKRAELLKTRQRFITRRDGCRSEACTLNLYLGRMREVTDIMAQRPDPR